MAAVEAILHKNPEFLASTKSCQVWPASNYRDYGGAALCSTSDQAQFLKYSTVIGVSAGEKGTRRSTHEVDASGDAAALAAAGSRAELGNLPPSSSGTEGMDGLEKDENDDRICQWILAPGENTHNYAQDGGRKEWIDGEDDTTMDMEAPLELNITKADMTGESRLLPLAHPFPKHALGFQYSAESLAAPGLDVDMDETQSIEDYDDSSDEEDSGNFKYNAWIQDIYNPMWLGHATLSGQKRREHEHEDNTDVDTQTEAASEARAAKMGRRQIMQPSLLRRKRAWKACQETSSSVGESEWSLAVNSPAPPAPPASTISSPRVMTPNPIYSAQEQNVSRQLPWRALVRRLRNVYSHGSMDTPRSFSPTPLAPHSPPPLFSPIPLSHQFQQTQKRARYSSNISDRGASPGFSEGPATPPPFMGVQMDFRADHIQGHWEDPEFGMMDMDPDFAHPPAVMGTGPLDPLARAKGLQGFLRGVDATLGSAQEHQPWYTGSYA